MSDTDAAAERLLPISVVAERVCFSRAHIMRLAGVGKFPLPIKLGERRIAFKQSEIAKWIDEHPRAWSQVDGKATT
jgi:predicted DNA-binding transcriptional regulator AlpA